MFAIYGMILIPIFVNVEAYGRYCDDNDHFHYQHSIYESDGPTVTFYHRPGEWIRTHAKFEAVRRNFYDYRGVYPNCILSIGNWEIYSEEIS